MKRCEFAGTESRSDRPTSALTSLRYHILRLVSVL